MNECILARFFPKLQQSQIIKGTEAETGLGGFRKFLVNRGVLGAIIWLLRSPEQGLMKSMEGRGRSMATQPVLASCEGGSQSPPRGCTLGYPLSFPSCLASTHPPHPRLSPWPQPKTLQAESTVFATEQRLNHFTQSSAFVTSTCTRVIKNIVKNK